MAKEKAPVDVKAVWFERIKVLLISALFASIANTIYTWRVPTLEMVKPLEVFPILGLIVAICIFCCLAHDLIDKVVPFPIPIILYIALVTTLLSFPNIGGPIAEFMITDMGKIQLLPLCTPILAYAGVAVGKDLSTFKQQGIAIVVVALITFFGTYVGSAIIAEVVLKATNVI